MSMSFANKGSAIERANKKARDTGEEWFVVFERGDEYPVGPYHVADTYDLDNWFGGTHPLYSTLD